MLIKAPFLGLFYVQDVLYAVGAWMRRNGVATNLGIVDVDVQERLISMDEQRY